MPEKRNRPKPRRWFRMDKNPPEVGREVIVWRPYVFFEIGYGHIERRKDHLAVMTLQEEGDLLDLEGRCYMVTKEMRWVYFSRPLIANP